MEASPKNPASLANGPRARFFLEGVQNPVHARVEHSDDEGMTLRQELPFLRLHRSIRDEEGREAELASVGVAMKDGTPSLVLKLRYAAMKRRDATMPFELPQDAPRAMRRRDETIPFGVQLALPDEPAHGGPLEGEDEEEPAAELAPWTGNQPWYVDLWTSIRAFFIREEC
ncbi:MAG: hypothetical protein JJ863_15740 [Deltaproteobacteria bacterium]|nr:hypothetical protein [Deltaproteobacteria bacterium]